MPRRCFLASSAFVNRPVDSITISAPTDFHQLLRVLFGNTRNSSPSTLIPLAVDVNIVVEIATARVILEQVRQCLCVRKVIHSYKIDIRITERSAEDIPSDATKTIDAYLHCHFIVDLLNILKAKPICDEPSHFHPQAHISAGDWVI